MFLAMAIANDCRRNLDELPTHCGPGAGWANCCASRVQLKSVRWITYPLAADGVMNNPRALAHNDDGSRPKFDSRAPYCLCH